MNDSPSTDPQQTSQASSGQSEALAAAVAAATAAASAANAAASAAASAANAANTIIAVVSGGNLPPPPSAAVGAGTAQAPPLSAPSGYNGAGTSSRTNIHNYNPVPPSSGGGNSQQYEYPPQQQAPFVEQSNRVATNPYLNSDGMAALPPPLYAPGSDPNSGRDGATGQWKAHHINRGRFHDAPWDDAVAGLVASGPVPLRVEWTPPPFFHLYASLEQSFARLSGYNKGSLFVGVTSAILGEGKTTVALHLALSAARATQKRVCLIDLSLGEDDLCRRVGAAPAPGGAVSLIEENGVLGVMELSDPNNLFFIPAGKVPVNPAQMARSKKMSEFFTTLRGEFDLVIVDMPAVVTDNAVPLAALMDGVVLVMQAGATPRVMVTEAVEKLGRDRVAGVVLNRIAPSLGQTLPTTRRGGQTGNEAAVGVGRNGRN